MSPTSGRNYPSGGTSRAAATPEAPGAVAFAAFIDGTDDARLVAALLLRPDVVVPPPVSRAVLARRLAARPSVQRVLGRLDAAALTVLEALAAAGATAAPVTLTALVDVLQARGHRGGTTTRRALTARVREILVTSVLPTLVAWEEPRGGRRTRRLWLAAAVADLLEPPRLLRPVATLAPHPTTAALPAALRPEDLRLLEALAAGGGIGTAADTAPDTHSSKPVPRLVAAGLLTRVSADTVRLPPAVAAALRHAAPDPLTAPLGTAPDPLTAPLGTAAQTADAGAGMAALELLRQGADLLTALGTRPAAALRSGGIGIRELRRLAKETGIPELDLPLLLTVLADASLIDLGLPEPVPEYGPDDDHWAPTVAVDEWSTRGPARRWATLVRAWWQSPRILPAGGPGSAAVLAPESVDPTAPLLRRHLCRALTLAPAGHEVDAGGAARLLAWARPLAGPRPTPAALDRHLATFRRLGLTAHGTPTAVARALVAESAPDGPTDDDATAALEAAAAHCLPTTVDHFLVQADLTLLAPGPLPDDLATEVDLVSDRESSGAASVHRITASSLRRALDRGRTSGDLHVFFTTHSRTPVPQALTYLIDDTARHHGSLRAGPAGSYLRSEDPAALAAALASPVASDLALRMLAPTVAVSPLPPVALARVLRAHGLCAIGETADGTVVELAATPHRVPAPRSPRRPRRRLPTTAELTAVVAALTDEDTPPPADTAARGPAALALLRNATAEGLEVVVGGVDRHGIATTCRFVPIALGRGVVSGTVPGDDRSVTFPLHRITTVSVASDRG